MHVRLLSGITTNARRGRMGSGFIAMLQDSRSWLPVIHYVGSCAILAHRQACNL
jgi:hypothetical protein